MPHGYCAVAPSLQSAARPLLQGVPPPSRAHAAPQVQLHRRVAHIAVRRQHGAIRRLRLPQRIVQRPEVERPVHAIISGTLLEECNPDAEQQLRSSRAAVGVPGLVRHLAVAGPVAVADRLVQRMQRAARVDDIRHLSAAVGQVHDAVVVPDPPDNLPAAGGNNN